MKLRTKMLFFYRLRNRLKKGSELADWKGAESAVNQAQVGCEEGWRPRARHIRDAGAALARERMRNMLSEAH